MVVDDAQDATVEDLDRRVPVAYVPGEARRVGGVRGLNVGDILVGSPDGDHPTAGQLQPVPIGQYGRLLEVEEEWLATVVGEAEPPTMTVVEN